jgi:hypothetical protein
VSGAVPRIVVVLPIEGRAYARLVCSTYEEERRLAGDLAHRHLPDEVIDALLRLLVQLDRLDEEAAA